MTCSCINAVVIVWIEGALQPRQANTILTITRNFLTTASNLPWQHDTALSVLPVQCSSTSCRASGFRLPTFQANVETLFESFVNSLPLFRTQDCLRVRILELSRAQNKMCTPASPRLSETQIAWKHAFWNFQGPKIPKCVLPPPPRLPEIQIAWEHAFWNFQGPKIKCILPPPPRLPEIQIAWEHAFWNFEGPKIPQCVLPRSTHLGTFKGPKYLNVYSRLPPASQRPRLPESTHFGTFKGPK